MGFMDKAKKLADQAQAKLDEVQTQFNEKQGSGASPTAPGAGSPPATEYDQQGRAVPPAPVDKAPSIDREATDPEPPHGDPLLTGEDASRHGADADRGEKPSTPPAPGSQGLTGGDPLAG